MRPQYSLVTAAVSEPLSIEQATDHVRIDSNEDLRYLNELVPVAREYVDSVTGRVSIASTWRVVAANWCDLTGETTDLIKLYRVPLVSVSSVKYYAPDATELSTLATTEYRVITTTEPGLVQLYGTIPSVDDRPDAIQIEFIAGYTDASEAPPILRHAQKLVVAHLYENRVPVNIGNIVNEVPYGLQTMLANQKIGGWLA